MGRAAILGAYALVALTACGGASPETDDSYERDRAAIEELRRKDIAATLAGDLNALGELWADDIVRLQPGMAPEVGKQTLLAADRQRRAAAPGFRALTYVPDIKDLVIKDGLAVEWGTFTASFVAAPGGEEQRIRANLVRVFRKQPDGSWKGAIGIWNAY